jgi:hypothetical protein
VNICRIENDERKKKEKERKREKEAELTGFSNVFYRYRKIHFSNIQNSNFCPILNNSKIKFNKKNF